MSSINSGAQKACFPWLGCVLEQYFNPISSPFPEIFILVCQNDSPLPTSRSKFELSY